MANAADCGCRLGSIECRRHCSANEARQGGVPRGMGASAGNEGRRLHKRSGRGRPGAERQRGSGLQAAR
ncbi:MAG: hypothetical protein HKK67_09060 [Chlorobiaceae bacterium]|nr:hypothetical protein [Chlorobiaceae bacterium]